jgi:cysteine synthase A
MVFVEKITDLIGNTPLIKLNKISKETGNIVLAKAEFMNPASSIKDRAALFMIENGEKNGDIKKGTIIVEPTSGNTGIGLALVCAVKKYRLILTMPETMSIERRNLLKAMGAELVLTPGDKGMAGSIDKAQEIISVNRGSYMPMQFSNQANPLAHFKTTAREIWNDTDGEIDWLVAGAGTGGTITGCAEYLKSKKDSFKAAVVEPWESSVISGEGAGPHRIQGIGAGFIPENLKIDLIDRVIRVRSEDAISRAKQLRDDEGIFAGISSASNVIAAKMISEHEKDAGKIIVTILCDSGERYISTGIFD